MLFILSNKLFLSFFFPKQYFDLIVVFSFLRFPGSKVEPVHHQTHIVGHIQPTLIFSGQTRENHCTDVYLHI